MIKIDKRYNPAGEYKDEMGNIQYYGNETDNYYSNIAQLTYSNAFGDNTTITSSISYNNGYGYYENYKTNRSLEYYYKIPPQLINNQIYNKSDVITQKLMSNNYYTSNVLLNYQKRKIKVAGGLFVSLFDGDHYGRLKWIKHNQNIPNNYEWYRNRSNKNEFSTFGKITYEIIPVLSLFGDIQYRHIKYNMKGIDDDFQDITSNKYYNFINPKFGLSYNKNNQKIYTTIAIANREPLRSDLKESSKGGNNNSIKPERLYDYEIGYIYSSNQISFNINGYYMYYKNQMIQTGKLNDIGYKVMENAPKSYRLGVEFIVGYTPLSWLRFDSNLTISQNKIKKYTAYYDLYNNQTDWLLIGQSSSYLGTTDISYSPNIVSSFSTTITPNETLALNINGKYVGKQYYDNTSSKNNQLTDYFITNLIATYSLKTNKLGSIKINFTINNILNKKYIANAWVATDKFEDGTEAVYKGYYPQAIRNFMIKLDLNF